MIPLLEQQTSLTGNQRRVIAAAVLGDMLEFFDYYLIGFVLVLIAGPWGLTFGQSALILLSSGFGAMFGAVLYGRLADRVGRRFVFLATILNTTVATGLLALTPDGGWAYLLVFRFLAGVGVGGLYSVDLPLVQEFVPASRRGFVSGLVTSFIPIGLLLASLVSATMTPYVGWRGLFAIGALPGLLVLLLRYWVPESPRWLLQVGRREEAQRSLAWALQVPVDAVQLPTAESVRSAAVPWKSLFAYPRSVAVSCLANLGAQTGTYGLKLWAPTLLVLVLRVTPQRAAFLMIFVSLAGFAGRVLFSYLSDKLGRRYSAAIYGYSACCFVITAAVWHDAILLGISVFLLLLVVNEVFVDGGWAVVGPYSAEVWPSQLRASGMGLAYGFGGFGKVIGPLGLALIVGSSNVLTPQASLDAIVPAFAYLGFWFALVPTVLLLWGYETCGESLETIESQLQSDAAKRSGAHHGALSSSAADGLR